MRRSCISISVQQVRQISCSLQFSTVLKSALMIVSAMQGLFLYEYNTSLIPAVETIGLVCQAKCTTGTVAELMVTWKWGKIVPQRTCPLLHDLLSYTSKNSPTNEHERMDRAYLPLTLACFKVRVSN